MISDKSPYTFEIIDTSESLKQLRSRWESLLNQINQKGPFFSWNWNFAWWKSFAEKGDQLAVIWAERNGEAFALAPFFIRRSSYYGAQRRLLRFLGEGHSDRADVFVREHDPVFYEALFGLLRERIEWDVIYLRELTEGSGFFNWVSGSGMKVYVEKDSECPYIPIQEDMTPDSFRQSLSRKTRAEFRNVSKRLENMGEGTFHHFPINDSDTSIFEMLRDIESSSSKATRNISMVFSPEGNLKFQRELLKQFGDSIKPLLSTLELNGEIIAYLYGFIADKVYHAYNMAFLPNYSRLSPGKLVMQNTIEYCIGEGMDEFDFLRGSSYIKSKWTDLNRQQHHLTIFRNTLFNRLHAWLIFALRPRLKPLIRWLRSLGSGGRKEIH